MGAPGPPTGEGSLVEAQRAATRARWFYTSLPIYGLLLILGVSVLPALLGLLDYRQTVPVLLFIGAIFVMFAGAWSDFGAKAHIREVIQHHLPFGMVDMDYVYRQQFLLMVAYLGVAGLYAVVAAAIILVG